MTVDAIRAHYDVLSPYYVTLWDRHIHHGYFLTGRETPAEATDALIRLLLQHADLRTESRVLDIGCGVGATAILLAEEFNCDVVGISLSPEQIRMAYEAAAHLPNPPHFLVQNADDLALNGQFDLIWSVEMISHLHDRERFFARVVELMKPGGRWCIAAWLKASDLGDDLERQYIAPIERGMLVNLPTKEEYLHHLQAQNLEMIHYQDISRNVARTWDISSSLINNPRLWTTARSHGPAFIHFLRAFRAMRAGFRSGCFRYAILVAAKYELSGR